MRAIDGATQILLASLPIAGCDAAPRFTEPMVLGGDTISAETLERGARTYALYCGSCHGDEGAGDGPAARGLPAPPRDFRIADFRTKSTSGAALPTQGDLEAMIVNGAPERGMPTWKGLNPEDVSAVAHFLKTFSPKWSEGSSQ
jgi:mono/diheme cytochrome c family protein